MRKSGFWLSATVIAIALVAAAGLGLWSTRLGAANQNLSLQLERERQRNFSEMVYHVEQIQGLLGKGVVAGTTPQNMRYLSDVYYHSQAATSNFKSLPMPMEVGASTGKFLQQVGDFASSLLRHEAAGRGLDAKTQAQMIDLRRYSQDLAKQLDTVATSYGSGRFRWAPSTKFSWSGLIRGAGLVTKPPTGSQAPSSLVPGMQQIGSAMERLPVLLYDGPFSDHVDKRSPAMAGAPIAQADAQGRLGTYVPNFAAYTVASAVEVNNSLPSWTFRLAPKGVATNGRLDYTTSVMVARQGGYLVQLLNGRAIGQPTLDLARARGIGQEYLTRIGYTGMVPTYGQVSDGEATVVYAFQQNGVVIYPDQIKVKVALDTGEITAVDAHQYLMNHHTRTGLTPHITPYQAEDAVSPNLTVQRVQPALIPDQAGTGEILTYEVLGTWGDETYLVYVNAETGYEEQILQQVNTDGGTFVL